MVGVVLGPGVRARVNSSAPPIIYIGVGSQNGAGTGIGRGDRIVDGTGVGT